MASRERLQAAPPIRGEHFTTASLDDCDARLAAASIFVNHDQVGDGPFCADIAQVSGGRGLKMSVANYSAPVTSRGASPDRIYALCLPLSEPSGAYFNHHPILPD